MRRVHVAVEQPYDVVIGAGALSELRAFEGRLAVCIDASVDRLHGPLIAAALAGRAFERFVIPPGEERKSVADVSALWDWLASHRFERHEPVVAIGGGVVGDLAGFAAATWRRGVPFVQVPTTLLAQVDASVGGKVAIDHASGKNLVGAFHQPVQVLAETSFLSTLPERESWSGLAEIVKTALLAGDPMMSLVESSLDALGQGRGPVEDIVAECVAYKAGVVQRDPFESGERAVLNLGHTVGHALEKAAGYGTLLHGEAVAYGLRAALVLSGLAASRSMSLVRRLKVPPLPPLAVDDVMEAMRDDKKVVGGRLRFVLLDAPGRAVRGREPDPVRVREVVEGVLSGVW